MPAALRNYIPDPLIKKPLPTIKKASWTSAGDSKGEDILQWLFLYLLSTFLSPPQRTALPDRLCCNSWLWFGLTESCGAVQLPHCVGARLPHEGNLSCPRKEISPAPSPTALKEKRNHLLQFGPCAQQRLRSIQVIFKPRHKGEPRPVLEVTNSSYFNLNTS